MLLTAEIRLALLLMAQIRHALLPAALLLPLMLCACEQKQPPPPPPPAVTVAQPVERVVTDALQLNGTTRAVRSVQLVARVPGYLEKVLFKDGQMVGEGQLLFLIQQDATRARLGQAEAQILQQRAQLDYAEKQLIRYTNMLSRNAAAQSDVDNWRYQRDSAIGNLKNAEAQRDLARLDLAYTRVSAPFAGRIDRHLRDRGNLVGSGENTVLAEMSQVDPIYIYFTISDLDLGRVMKSSRGMFGRKGGLNLPISVGLPGEEGFPHQGRLEFAATTLSDSTGTLLLRGVLPNAGGGILPGLQARVRVPLQSRRALVVPETAVSSDQQGTYLLVVGGDNVVQRRPVKTGFALEHMRVIEEGLQGGEWVVVRGLLRAAPGKKVTPEREGAGNPPSQPPPAGGRSSRTLPAHIGEANSQTVPAPGGGGPGRGNSAATATTPTPSHLAAVRTVVKARP